MNPSLLDTLKTRFGYNSFRPNQERVIQSILSGTDCLTILPTGSGKSLCFQLPALLMDGLTIVISPLIALMQDQVIALQKLDIPAVFITSTLTAQDRAITLSQLDRYKLLYISPERLSQPDFLALIQSISISCIVIDEAHCISQWGHSFRPDYRHLTHLKTWLPNTPIAAFTATATAPVQSDMITLLQLDQPTIVRSTFDRPNLRVRIAEKLDSTNQLLSFLADHTDQSGIIYCSTRKNVEKTVALLTKKGIQAGAYHAGLSDTDRHRTHQAFLTDQLPIVVATVAFGMGIHKPDIRWVFHMNMPQSVEHYYQEIGRAGRDGLPSDVMMLYGIQDVMIQKRFADDISDATAQHASRHKTEQLFALCQSIACRRVELLRYFGETYAAEHCDSCDNCTDTIAMEDGTIVAQKILSCVFRLRQQFGINAVIDVLIGSQNQAIRSRRHDQLSTYGLLSTMSRTDIKFYIFNLVNAGYLYITNSDYPLLTLTARSSDILYHQQPIQFRKRTCSAPTKTTQRPDAAADKPLLARLKAHRKALATARHMAPFMIFHDKTLIEMATSKPRNDVEFLLLNGVGPSKLSQFGESFLAIINETASEPVTA